MWRLEGGLSWCSLVSMKAAASSEDGIYPLDRRHEEDGIYPLDRTHEEDGVYPLDQRYEVGS
jgi:hypothetical protein